MKSYLDLSFHWISAASIWPRVRFFVWTMGSDSMLKMYGYLV